MYVFLADSQMKLISYDVLLFFLAPLEKGSKLEELVKGIRTRKGLKPDIPALDNFYDKL